MIMVKAAKNETIPAVAQAPVAAAAPANDTPSFELETAPFYERTRRRPGASVYPWAGMQIGQRFFVPDKTVKEFSGTVSSGRKSSGFTFDTFLNTADVPSPKLGDDGKPVAGVWVQRVADRPIQPRAKRSTAAANTGAADAQTLPQVPADTTSADAQQLAGVAPAAPAPAPLAPLPPLPTV